MTSVVIKLLIVAAACVSSYVAQDARESRIVKTAQGPVRGYKTDDIYHFYGIPYATAPTGTRRFTAPLPAPIWMSPLEAVNNKIMCPQAQIPMPGAPTFDMRENCLVANIYVPDTKETDLPVVVYVHGGAYQAGFGELASPAALVRTKKLVAVTFNYRLGVHGFLCLGTENAPGNAGMKDQVALLRWVQENIANFGGNPTDVTIAGYSAGASAVDLLMLSEMTKGLYNKVIPESAASVGACSVQLDPVQNAKDFAKQLNFSNVNDIDALDDFFASLSYDAMASISVLERPDSTFVFTPCVERKTSTGAEIFLDDNPVNILTSARYRKVPILYGFANMEGIFRVPLFGQWKDKMNEKFSDFLPGDLQFKNDEERERIANEVKTFYFGDKHVSVETIQGYIDYFSDVLFSYPSLRSAKLQVEAGSDSLYLYEYSFFTPYPEGLGIAEYIGNIKGSSHCAQTSAILESQFFGADYSLESDEYKKMRKIMVDIWVNFITTGKPVPDGSDLPSWPPVGANRSPYMSLGEEIKLKERLLETRALFWDNIYDRFYRSPMAPFQSTFRDEF